MNRPYRLNDLALPLGASDADVRAAVLAHLKLTDVDVEHIHVHRRGYDARKKSDIHFVYT